MCKTFLVYALALGSLWFANLPAKAQEVPNLNNRDLRGAAPYGTPIVDDRLYVHGVFNQLEGRLATNPYFRWDGQTWAGNDFNKLWVKSEGRVNADGKGKMSDGDTEFLYDRPLSTYFNLQAGVRSDLDSMPNRTWAALGIQGLAVGNWNVELTGYASTEHRFALKTNASWDYRFTQRLILQPQFETNFYTRDELSRGIGSGLSDIDGGLRLRYEFSRKFAPYIGVTYHSFFFNTATVRQQSGSEAYDVRGVVGLRTWF
jgi:copper resistance protein B